MKGWYSVLVIVCLTALISCSEKELEQRVKFVDSVRLFEEFQMKKEYDQILEEDLKQESSLMDSIRILMENTDDTMKVFQLRKDYYLAERLFNGKYEELSGRYTAMVTERLNEYLKSYGDQEDLDIIVSGGNGNVLYVRDQVDITDQVIEFANKKFEE